MLIPQESQEGRESLCATLCFEMAGQELINRISNQIYDRARSGDLQLPSFPQFEPVLNALKNGSTVDGCKSYRVSMQRADQLMVLDSFAKKWLDNPLFEAQAKKVIEEHNQEYNASGEFLMTSAARFGFFQKIQHPYATNCSQSKKISGLSSVCVRVTLFQAELFTNYCKVMTVLRSIGIIL